jgi:hypothetical protein
MADATVKRRGSIIFTYSDKDTITVSLQTIVGNSASEIRLEKIIVNNPESTTFINYGEDTITTTIKERGRR